MVHKALAKAGGRSALKKIPLIGAALGTAFAIDRLRKGDFLGAGLEFSSGMLGLVPGLGTSLGFGIDGFLLARDLGMTPMANGGLLSAATPVIAGERGREAIAPLEGSEGQIAGSVFGDATAQSLVNFLAKRKNKGALPKSLLDAYPNLDPTKARDYMKLKRLMRESDFVYSGANNPSEASNMLNNTSAQTSMGSIMMPTTIVNNNYVAAGSGGDSGSSGSSAFPSDYAVFAANYSLASKA